MRLSPCFLILFAAASSPVWGGLRERAPGPPSGGSKSKPAADKSTKAPPRRVEPEKSERSPANPFPGVSPLPQRIEGEPKPVRASFPLSKGPWRLRAGGFGGWWWGDLRDKERAYAENVLVDLGGGDVERLKVLHLVMGPFASASWSIRPWLYAGLRAQMIFVTQSADLPEDVDPVSGGVWRTGGIQTILTFYPRAKNRVQPYLEVGYGPAWGSWTPFVVARKMPPKQRLETFAASGELWGLGLGWEYAQTPRTAWAVDFRWNVGDFVVDGIPEAQYNGHFTLGLAAVFRP